MIKNMFWGREIEDWEDIYSLMVFREIPVKSFTDLLAWNAPASPQDCVNLAFDLAEARAMNYDIPVRSWVYNILVNDKRDHTKVENAPLMVDEA